jgi:hypothetical protein
MKKNAILRKITNVNLHIYDTFKSATSRCGVFNLKTSQTLEKRIRLWSHAALACLPLSLTKPFQALS